MYSWRWWRMVHGCGLHLAVSCGCVQKLSLRFCALFSMSEATEQLERERLERESSSRSRSSCPTVAGRLKPLGACVVCVVAYNNGLLEWRGCECEYWSGCRTGCEVWANFSLGMVWLALGAGMVCVRKSPCPSCLACMVWCSGGLTTVEGRTLAPHVSHNLVWAVSSKAWCSILVLPPSECGIWKAPVLDAFRAIGILGTAFGGTVALIPLWCCRCWPDLVGTSWGLKVAWPICRPLSSVSSTFVPLGTWEGNMGAELRMSLRNFGDVGG